MPLKRNLFIVLIPIFFSANFLFGNYAFKKKVREVCKSYRIPMESSQLDLGKSEITISMESGRNNFEMYMLVGFASAGQAIAHQKEMNLSNAYIPLIISLNVAVLHPEMNSILLVQVVAQKWQFHLRMVVWILQSLCKKL